MTDRVHSLTVVLESNVRTDDVKAYVDAIMMMRGVQDVGLNIDDAHVYVATERARQDIAQRLWEVLNSKE